MACWLLGTGINSVLSLRQKLTLANPLAQSRINVEEAMCLLQSHEGIILVADDIEANRELLSALLSTEGYQVVCVEGRPASTSSVEAIRLISRCWMW